MLGGFALRSHASHELSHLWEQDCVGYGNTIGLFLFLSLGCCALMLTRPVLERIFSKSSGHDTLLPAPESRRG